MLALIIFGALGFALFFLALFLIRAWLFKRHLKREFERCNVIVAGKKGSGKDLLFQAMINARKKPYYGNIDYGGDYEPITLKEVSTAPNTYFEFIKDNITEIERRFVEDKDIYISDGGIFLPSYMDSTLYKQFPSFPIFYALSRHISHSNVHVNVQNFGRLWKALREQADAFVYVKKTISVPFFLAIRANWYDKYESAEARLEPVKSRFFNKFSKAETDIYTASNGDIKCGWVIIRKSSVRYDTRAFEKVLYGNQPRLKGAQAQTPKK